MARQTRNLRNSALVVGTVANLALLQIRFTRRGDFTMKIGGIIAHPTSCVRILAVAGEAGNPGIPAGKITTMTESTIIQGIGLIDNTQPMLIYATPILRVRKGLMTSGTGHLGGAAFIIAAMTQLTFI